MGVRKNIFQSFLRAFVICIFTLSINAYAKDISFIKYFNVLVEANSTDPEDPDTYRREPEYEVPCSIDQTLGITLQGEGIVEIKSYEIWDKEKNKIDAFEDESEFLKILFSLRGTYTILLFTSNHIYIGNITI